MSISDNYLSHNPSLTDQLGDINAEVHGLRQQGKSDVEIASAIQSLYTTGKIPAPVLFAMLQKIQQNSPPVPAPNSDSIAVQAAKKVLMMDQAKRTPGMDIQRLQAMFAQPQQPPQGQAPQGQQPMPQPGQGQGAPQTMMQQAPQGPVMQARSGGLADLPKPNVGDDKAYARGGIVAFSNRGAVEGYPEGPAEASMVVPRAIGKGLSWLGDKLGSAATGFYDPELGTAYGSEYGPDKDSTSGGPPGRRRAKPSVLGEKVSDKPAVLEEDTGPSGGAAKPTGPYAGGARPAAKPSNPVDKLNAAIDKPPDTIEDVIDKAKKFGDAYGVGEGDETAQKRYAGLAGQIDAARDRALKDADETSKYESILSAASGEYGTGLAGAFASLYKGKAAAAKARADANKEHLAQLTGLTKDQVTVDLARQQRASQLQEMSIRMYDSGRSEAAQMLAKAAELFMRGQEAEANLLANAAWRAAQLQERALESDQAAEVRREALLARPEIFQTYKSYLIARDGNAASGVPPDPAKAARLRQLLRVIGIKDPDRYNLPSAGGSGSGGYTLPQGVSVSLAQ
jgi:hypothetical protein